MQKFGPKDHQANDEDHSIERLKLSSEAGVNRQQKCERFFIGDEVAVPTRYRVYGRSKSGRLFECRG